MQLLVRKVQLSKWTAADWAGKESIPADAITLDLKTRSNCLSFWLAESESDVAQAVAAIAAGLERIEAIDIVAVPIAEFDGAALTESPGRTGASELRTLHRDVVEISHEVLAQLSRSIAAQVYEGGAKRYTRSELILMLKEVDGAGGLDEANLSEKVLEVLRDV